MRWPATSILMPFNRIGPGRRRVAPKPGGKYTGKDLRKIRGRNGIGRPPEINLKRMGRPC